MGFDVSSTGMQALLNPVWENTIQETDEFSAAFWNRLEDLPEEDANVNGSSSTVYGRKVKVRTGYNESESWAGFGSTSGYAQGGNSSFTTFQIPYRTMSSQGLIDQEAIDNDSADAKYHPVVQEMASTMLAAFKKLNRACLMGDGTGAIGVVSGASSGATFTCDPTYNTNGFGNKGCQFIKPGKKVQVVSTAGSVRTTGASDTVEGIATVSSKVNSTGVVTCAATVATNIGAGDLVVPERSYGRGINGIEYWVANSGSLFALSRSTYPGLQSTITSGASGSLVVAVESMFSQMAHYIEEDVALGLNGEGGNEFFWSPTQREGYRKQAIGLGIMMLGADKVDVGYAHKESINGYDFTVMKDHSNTRINCLRLKDWYRISRGGKKPFDRVKIHGSDFYNTADSQGRISGGLGFIIGGYVNIACRNVRNQSAITSLPISGLNTGNV